MLQALNFNTNISEKVGSGWKLINLVLKGQDKDN
jgi:hypothetical protein